MKSIFLVVAACCVLANVGAQSKKETTPIEIEGFETFIYAKAGDHEMRLHVVKPKNWEASEKLPCLVYFFGGGWNTGNPKLPSRWGRWAAEHGIVGILPDYRTKSRHGASPEDCVSDGRKAVKWIQEHATQLGIDPAKIICGGESAGGHVAAWTAISEKGPGKDDPGAPNPSPAALVLLCPVTDSTDSGFGGTKRFGKSPECAEACSVNHQMSKKMPPSVVFHGTEDKAVPYANSLDFRDRIVKNGGVCELVPFEGMGHMYWTGGHGDAGSKAKDKTEKMILEFLAKHGLMQQ